MKLPERIKLVKYLIDKIREDLIPYSSNLPHTSVKYQTAHRLMQLELVRANPKTSEQKAFVEELRNWNLDLSSEKQRYPLRGQELYVKTYNAYLTLQEIIEELRSMNYKKNRPSSFNDLESSARRALKFGIGNCYEVSAYLFLLMLEYPKEGLPNLPLVDEKIPIELVYFKDANGQHVMVVIGRDPSSDLKDPSTWNKDTIIGDAWTREAYTIEHLFEKKNKNEEENEAEQKFILNLFKALELKSPSTSQHYYLGEQFNERIHSKEWYQKVDSKKFWRPNRLLDVKKRPMFEEKWHHSRDRYEPSLSQKLLKKFKKEQVKYHEMCNPFVELLNDLRTKTSSGSACTIADLQQLKILYNDYYKAKKKCYVLSKEIISINLNDKDNKPKSSNLVTDFYETCKKESKFDETFYEIFEMIDEHIEAKNVLKKAKQKLLYEYNAFGKNQTNYQKLNKALANYKDACSCFDEDEEDSQLFMLAKKGGIRLISDVLTEEESPPAFYKIIYCLDEINIDHATCVNDLQYFVQNY